MKANHQLIAMQECWRSEVAGWSHEQLFQCLPIWFLRLKIDVNDLGSFQHINFFGFRCQLYGIVQPDSSLFGIDRLIGDDFLLPKKLLGFAA